MPLPDLKQAQEKGIFLSCAIISYRDGPKLGECVDGVVKPRLKLSMQTVELYLI